MHAPAKHKNDDGSSLGSDDNNEREDSDEAWHSEGGLSGSEAEESESQQRKKRSRPIMKHESKAKKRRLQDRDAIFNLAEAKVSEAFQREEIQGEARGNRGGKLAVWPSQC